MPKSKEIYEVKLIDITRSYSRKLNMGAHGGKQYETLDLFASRTAKDVPVEDSAQVSKDLYKMCIEEVEEVIEMLDSNEEEIKKTEVETPKKKVMKTHVGVEIEQAELEEIAVYINNFTLSKSIDEIKEAVTEVKNSTIAFTDSQKQYLSLYYKKCLEALQPKSE